MIFKTKNKKIDEFRLYYNDEEIQSCNSAKYLGLTITRDLSWSSHIDCIRKRIVPMIGALRRIRQHVGNEILMKLYYAHVYSHLSFMSVVWSAATNIKINQLKVLQNKAIKIINGLPNLTPSSSLYNRNLLSLEKTIELAKVMLIHKIKHNLTRHSQELTTNAQRHNHNTRRNITYAISGSRNNTNFGQRSIINTSLVKYNELPNDVRNIQQQHLFKKEVIKLMHQ